MQNNKNLNYMKLPTISSDTTKLLEGLGFNFNIYKDTINYELNPPTLALAQMWLREKHNIHVNPIPNFKTTWNQYHLGIVFRNNKGQVDMIALKEKEGDVANKLFESYDEALEAGILEGIKLIKSTTYGK